jgi:hypothetical protein
VAINQILNTTARGVREIYENSKEFSNKYCRTNLYVKTDKAKTT